MSDDVMRPIRVGIAGLGRSGWGNHAQALSVLSDRYTVAAVSDHDPARLAEAATRFGCRTYARTQDLLRDEGIELVVVATPSKDHAGHAEAALRAGHHVVCEKPMTLGTAEADRVIEVAKQTGRVLAPFQNLRYSPDFLKVREVIDSGVLGRIIQIRTARHGFGRRWDWQTLREFGGGELNNTGPHAIDQALALFGPAEPEVFYHSDRALTLGDAEDHVKIGLRAPGQPLVEIEISRGCAYPQDLWHVMGTSGGLRGSATELHWKFVDFSSMPERQAEREPTPGRTYNSETLNWTEGRWVAADEPKAMPTRDRFYADLYRTLREGAPLVVTPESVRRQLAVIETCHAMAEPAAAARPLVRRPQTTELVEIA